jgi:multidrug efflux pump subunit AcrA (membrane-fusion protein)
MAGGSAFTIADLSQAEIDFYMDQDDWSNVKVGYQVQVIFDALPDQTFTGTVTEVQPGLVSAGGSSMVEGVAVLDDSYRGTQLPTGVSAAIDVISGQSLNVVLVPVEALHKLSEGQYAVFVMQNDDPKLTMVGVGLQDDTFVEIRSGVKAGDVVTTGVVETNQ